MEEDTQLGNVTSGQHLRKETPWTSMIKKHDFGPLPSRSNSNKAIHPPRPEDIAGNLEGKSNCADEDAYAADARNKRQRDSSEVTPEMLELKSWLKANIPQAQVFLDPKMECGSMHMPLLGGNSEQTYNQNSILNIAKDNGSAQEVHWHTEPSSHGVKRWLEQPGGSESETVNKFRHARKDSPFEIWMPTQSSDPKRHKQESYDAPGNVVSRGKSIEINLNVQNDNANYTQNKHKPIMPNPSQIQHARIDSRNHTQNQHNTIFPNPSQMPNTNLNILKNYNNYNNAIHSTRSLVEDLKYKGQMAFDGHPSHLAMRSNNISEYRNPLASKYSMKGTSSYLGNGFKPQILRNQDRRGRKKCTCKRTKCLKLYCPCFADGIFCSEICNCNNCMNIEEHQREIQEARYHIENKTPDAFKPKITLSKASKDNLNSSPFGNGFVGTRSPFPQAPMFQHQRGCNCVKSNCIKRYCECFAAGILCGPKCSCIGCMNNSEAIQYNQKNMIGNAHA